MNKKMVALLSAVTLISAGSAFAHFQMVYTPEMAMNKGGEIPLKIVFTHPFEAGHTMDMGEPEEFYVVRTRGENAPKKTDLKDTLKPIEWTSLTNAGKGYETTYKLRGGDYAFCLVPAPYYEAEEDSYIQQFTKVIVNVGGEPGAWMDPVGLKAEIVPLAKPYDRWVGNVFQGVVTGNGKPVPHAEIEIEYMNHKPDLEKNKFAKKADVEAPQDSFVLQTIFADENGVFTFGIPKAGWWGFAALGATGDVEFEGKPCSQDAVIWIQAKDID